jgi:hypothetical protein
MVSEKQQKKSAIKWVDYTRRKREYVIIGR